MSTISDVKGIVACVLANPVTLPLTVAFGSAHVDPEYQLEITERDMQDVTPLDLEEQTVILNARIDANKNVRYILIGEWNALESFMKENFRVGSYHSYMQKLEAEDKYRNKI